MNPITALSIDGTSRFSVLCYGILGKDDLCDDDLHNDDKSYICYILEDQNWPSRIVVLESIIDDYSLIPAQVSRSFYYLFDKVGCKYAISLYDGAFNSFNDIVSDEFCDQTYAFCNAINEPVIALNENLLNSIDWKNAVSASKESILQEIH